MPRIGTLALAGASDLSFSLRIRTTGSHVPHQSLIHVHAAFMPDASQALNRFALTFIPGYHTDPGFDVILGFSTRHRRFTFVRLHGSHLTQSLPRLFLQRSPPRLFTPAACSGLRSAPASLPRRARPHLRQSIVARVCYLLSATLGASFVTHMRFDPFRLRPRAESPDSSVKNMRDR